MSGRFVRASKYRHIFGKPTRKEFCYDNLHISRNAWDTNLIKANPLFLSVNWEASGGGAFAVIPVNERGKLPDQLPLFRGHTAPVLDTDWNPFNDYFVASGSDDGKVCLWQVPRDFTLYTDAEEVPHVSPISSLKGHSRKVGQVLFNPAAENILASSSADLSLNIWDISTGQAALSLKHTDMIQSLSWNAAGSLIVTTARDKKLRVWDVRQEKPVSEHAGHAGAKNSRGVWMGEHNRIATTGFSRMSERQVALWEPGRETPINGFMRLDSISGVCMPFWDEGSNCLYLAGKGDGNIRYYEYQGDKLEYLSEYKSADPQRGVAFVPRRGINVREHEVMRCYKTVNDTYIEPISFTVPRRAETFQSDIYPPAISTTPGVSAQEWLAGKTTLPLKIDLESIFDGTAPVEVQASEYRAPEIAPSKNLEPITVQTPTTPVAPAPAPRAVPEIKDQKASISAMASKYKDHEESDASVDDGDSETFDQVTRPVPRGAAPVCTASPTSITKIVSSPVAPASQPSIVSRSPAAVATSSPSASSFSDTSASLTDIKRLLETQTRLLEQQNQKIRQLTDDVESLKAQLTSSSSAASVAQDQSERIRQLELELEAARS